jgi:DNA-binding CsgD family transcriptional regulator
MRWPRPACDPLRKRRPHGDHAFVRAFEIKNSAGCIPYVRLSLSERRVLGLLLRCHPPKGIAIILGLSPETVRGVLTRLRLGLDCHSSMELVRWSFSHGEALGGSAVPKLNHPAGCKCDAAYCRLMG